MPEDCDLSLCIPLLFHADDADAHRRRTFNAMTISSPLSDYMECWDTRLLMCVLDNARCLPETYDVVELCIPCVSSRRVGSSLWTHGVKSGSGAYLVRSAARIDASLLASKATRNTCNGALKSRHPGCLVLTGCACTARLVAVADCFTHTMARKPCTAALLWTTSPSWRTDARPILGYAFLGLMSSVSCWTGYTWSIWL